MLTYFNWQYTEIHISIFSLWVPKVKKKSSSTLLESNDFIPQKEIVRFPIPKLVYRFLLKIMPKYGAKLNFLLIYLTSLGNTEQIFNVCEKSMFQLITPKQIEHSMYSVGFKEVS